MSILKISYCTSQHDLQIAERESEEQREGRGWRVAASRELRLERERRPSSGRESSGQRVGKRATAGEQRPTSRKERE
jgi:hypothetical protein